MHWYLAWNIIRTRRFKFVVTNGHVLIRGHSFIYVYIAKTFKILLVNNRPECIDIWHGSSLGPGDSSLFK